MGRGAPVSGREEGSGVGVEWEGPEGGIRTREWWGRVLDFGLGSWPGCWAWGIGVGRSARAIRDGGRIASPVLRRSLV